MNCRTINGSVTIWIYGMFISLFEKMKRFQYNYKSINRLVYNYRKRNFIRVYKSFYENQTINFVFTVVGTG